MTTKVETSWIQISACLWKHEFGTNMVEVLLLAGCYRVYFNGKMTGLGPIVTLEEAQKAADQLLVK